MEENQIRDDLLEMYTDVYHYLMPFYSEVSKILDNIDLSNEEKVSQITHAFLIAKEKHIAIPFKFFPELLK